MTFTLREYQKTALDVIHHDLSIMQNVLCCAIMGAGKTILTARLIYKYYTTTDRKFLILAHKKELVEQFLKAFITKTGVDPYDIGVCCAGLHKKEINKRITIGSIQTFINHGKNYTGCDLFVIDEVHRCTIGTNSQYDQIIDSLRSKNSAMRLLGLTATPFRLGAGYIYGDKCKPGTINLFSKINHKITYHELLEKKFLMPLQGKVAVNDQLAKDLENVDKNGDYVLEQLGVMMQQQIHIETAVEAIQLYTDGYKRICVFACTINHAEDLQKAIDIKYPGKCTIVHSNLNSIQRDKNMADWKAGIKPIMVSINILIEGFDYPELDCLVCARPTESVALFLQLIGRLLRMAEGKENALLIDLTTNTDKFGTDLDNMRVTIPKSALEVGKKKSEKICPKCDELVHVAIRICPKCGHEWTVEENEKIIATQMPELKTVLFKKKEKEIIITTPVWYIVYDMMAHIHVSKKNNKMLGKISLYYGDFDHVYNVFICMPDFYDGYAVEKAKEIWKKFSVEPFPKDIKEFNELSRSIKKPERILLSTDGKWPKLVEIDFELPF